MDWRNYLGSIWLAFVVLLVFNVLYIALGFSTILLFNQGVYALFSVVGVIGFFVPIVTYGYVTWRVKNKQKGDALDSAAAAVVLFLLVFVAAEVVGIVATSSTFSSIVPSSLVSTAV